MKYFPETLKELIEFRPGRYKKIIDGKRNIYIYFPECKNCKQPFLAVPNTKGKFCSPGCANRYNRRCGPRNGRYTTGYYVNNGYAEVYYNGERKRLHRMIAERVLGRPLKSNEMVHHINMNKMDNRNCNLVICDKAYHRTIHHNMAKAWVRAVGL